jgi:hypothetical protein
MALERNEGERVYSAGVGNGRFHRPDLIVLGGPAGSHRG